MSYTLVLVGGTGQRFGLGLGYLNLLGIAKMPDRVVVVDADGANRPNRVTATAAKLLRFGQASISFKHIVPYPGNGGGKDMTVSQCVDTSGSDLFPLCYSVGETKLSISDGFYATPKLAALVFRGLVNDRRDLFREEFRDGAATANVQRNVFIVGSVAGGTGAGIMRELATAYRKGNCRVFGIVFSRYFDVAKGPPSSDDLDRNARVGCDYLLKRDRDSPFEVLAMVGPPAGATLPPPVNADTGLPHAFPGLLSALSLVTDGGAGLVTRYDQGRINNASEDQTPVRLDLAFGARGEGEQLHDTDIWFPTQDARGTTGYISLADARDAAEEAKRSLAAWREFPFEAACGGSALFVERKLGARVSQTLRKLSDTGHIARQKALQLWEKLTGQDGAIREAQEGLESFERWIVNIVDSKGMRRRQAGSADVNPTRWREALEQAAWTEPKEQLDAVAQAWCISVARGQWRARLHSNFDGQGGRWLFPYATAGCSSAAGALSPLPADIAVELVESRSYPTPFGQAHAFGKRIELRDRQALRDAEILWLALAVGWLRIDVRDLESSPSAFERLAVLIDPQARFIGILRVRRGDDLPGALAALAGKVVGATYPSCGPWPGLRDDVRETLKALDDALEPKDRTLARQVLRRWRESLTESLGPAGMPTAAWWKVVMDLTSDDDHEGMVAWDHVRTRGPIALACAERVVPLHVFAHESNRAAKCNRLLGALAADASLQGNSVMLHGHEIAQVQRRIVRDTHKQPDWDASLRSGHLDFDLHAIDLHALPEHKGPVRERLMTSAGVPAELLASWPDLDTADVSPHRPDLTWRRIPEAIVVRDLTIHVKALPRNTASLRLSDTHKDGPDVPGIAFHPGRGTWVVWLYDPSTNPSGACKLVSGSIIRVESGKRSWLLHFPPDTIIHRPQDIVSLEGYKLSSRLGPVSPALPIKNEYIDLVQCDDGLRPAELRNNRLWFRFRLFGNLDVTYSLEAASFVEEDKLHIELWPDVPQPSWKRFWLGIETDQARTPYEYAIYRRSIHGYYELQSGFGGAADPRGVNRYVSVDGRPRLVWMGTPGKGAGFVAFPDEGRAALPALDAVRDATIAIDFGTFRTALLVAMPSNQVEMPWPPSSRDRLPGHRRMLADNEDKARAHRGARSLFPPTSGPPAGVGGIGGTIATVLGSTVVFHSQNIPDASSIPFQDFSIPFVRSELTEFPGTNEQAKAGLKWSDDEATSAIRTGYLKAVLLLGAVEAFERGATVLNIRYSFPLAYDLPEALNRSFEKARAWLESDVLERREGLVEVRLLKPDSESNAGIKAAEAFEDWIVTLDLGGGTLDLGIYHERDAPIAWDSVKLGGNLVSAAYAANKEVQERTVRWQIITDGVDYGYEPLVKDSDKLLRLAMEYAARVVAGTLGSHASKPTGATVTAVLLGSGWRWDRCRSTRARFDAVGFEQHYGKLMERRVQELAPGVVRRVRINATLLDQDREKLAVARGLARSTPQNLDIRDSIRAPNGLDESGRPWHTMVHREEAFGAPRTIDPQPAFPKDLEVIATFNTAFQRSEVPQAILYRLQSVTNPINQFRKRTALGLTYEYLTSDWFRR